jgi:hypothetical protein
MKNVRPKRSVKRNQALVCDVTRAEFEDICIRLADLEDLMLTLEQLLVELATQKITS